MSFPLDQEGENLSTANMTLLGVERLFHKYLFSSCYCSQTQICQTFCCMLSIERGVHGVN